MHVLVALPLTFKKTFPGLSYLQRFGLFSRGGEVHTSQQIFDYAVTERLNPIQYLRIQNMAEVNII
jgi:cbb3-type cytochrome oxidase subunit 1